jgi:serine/threonine protein kinase/TolB-like protein/Flp pilus assembly protein TadD
MIGTSISHYKILGKLGGGGMGVVYRAEDLTLGRQVALKFLPDTLAEHPEALARFRREARAASALNHPHICTIHELGEEDGRSFIVMELMDGQSLERRISGQPMPAEQIVRFGVQVADALKAAHGVGIVHRDLKPANLFVTERGDAKVLDFGLAKVTEDQARRVPSGVDEVEAATELAPERLTKPGTAMGTVAYMSPEQVHGEELDERTDLFSLGAVLYEMATGRQPFEGKTAGATFDSILNRAPVAPVRINPELPVDLERVINRLLQKDRKLRYQTASDLLAELRLIQRDSGSSRTPATQSRIRTSSESIEEELTVLQVPARWRPPAWAAIAMAIALVVSLVLWFGVLRQNPGSPTAPAHDVIRSIAVLPLDNYSGDPAQDYFAEGMTDELTTDLAMISRLRVISRGSAMQFGGAQRPPTPDIARMLDVDAVVEGSVRRIGDKVRITAQLIDARADRHLWGGNFEGSSRDVLALQAELASAIAREIDVQLTPAEQSRLTTAPTVDPVAHDAYLKGRYFFARPSDENLKKAITYFEEAVKLSPTFAPAFSGLSDAYLWAGYNEGVMTAAEARPKAKAAAERAIQLDDSSAEAHTSLAVFKLFYEYDWAGSEREFRRAIALNPNYAYAHDQFGLGLAFQGRLDEAIAEGKRAAELDPLSPQIPIDNSIALMFQGDYQAAKEQARRASELDPTFFFPHLVDGWADLEAGKPEEAIPALKRAKAMESPSFVTAFLAYAYGASGDRARAMIELEELAETSPRGEPLPFELALVSLGLGEYGRAVDYLEQAYAADSQWMGWLYKDRIFDPLRSEPRFAALIEKLGFASGGSISVRGREPGSAHSSEASRRSR